MIATQTHLLPLPRASNAGCPLDKPHCARRVMNGKHILIEHAYLLCHCAGIAWNGDAFHSTMVAFCGCVDIPLRLRCLCVVLALSLTQFTGRRVATRGSILRDCFPARHCVPGVCCSKSSPEPPKLRVEAQSYELLAREQAYKYVTARQSTWRLGLGPWRLARACVVLRAFRLMHS
jgi:hypothetical protein